MPNYQIADNEENCCISKVRESAYLSFILGIVLLIAVPITLIFNVNLWSEGPNAGPTRIPMNLAYPAGIVGICLVLTIATMSIILGIRGLWLAIKYKYSKVVSLTAVLISIVAFILWIIVSVDLFFILDTFRCVHY